LPARAPSRALFLALLGPRFAPDARVVAEALERPGDFDWDWMLERATAHKVAPLVAARLAEAHVADRLAPVQRDRIEAIRIAAADHVEVARRTLAFVERHLGGAGIPYLVIKGSVLAELVYPKPALRTFSDVDVVVAPDRFAAAVEVLESVGCRIAQVRQTLGAQPPAAELDAARRLTRAFYERFDRELPLLPPPGSETLAIDLHWQVAPRSRLADAPARLWERTRRVRIGDVEVTTLDPEATLAHLAVHATTCAFAGFRLLHLCDVAWTAAAAGDVELGKLLQHASGHVKAIVGLATELFGCAATTRHRLPVRYAPVARPSFLIDGLPQAASRRLWAELMWGRAMGCLGATARRALAIRLTRARWRSIQRRARRSAIAG
jgi:putative nucleotidyltransferase-like protein